MFEVLHTDLTYIVLVDLGLDGICSACFTSGILPQFLTLHLDVSIELPGGDCFFVVICKRIWDVSNPPFDEFIIVYICIFDSCVVIIEIIKLVVTDYRLVNFDRVILKFFSEEEESY